LLSGLQTLAELNGLVGDDSSGGRYYVRITEVEPRLIQRGLSGLHRGLVLANRLRRSPARRAIRLDPAASTLPVMTNWSFVSRAITPWSRSSR
jgi:hypothetical protein